MAQKVHQFFTKLADPVNSVPLKIDFTITLLPMKLSTQNQVIK